MTTETDIRSDLPIGEFVVITLTDSEDGSLARYMQRLQTQGDSGRLSQSFSSLPPGYRYLATWQPHLPSNLRTVGCSFEFVDE